jgi:limonene-1,2-epoxide hydrolase
VAADAEADADEEARGGASTHTGAEAVVDTMWRALSARDWDGVAAQLAPDCIYLDVPVGPAAAARGPVDIVKRLTIGLAPLASYENFPGLMVSNGADVMYEHHEQWRWATGESAVLNFVSVHRVEAGAITLWKDYWDMSALAAHAPATWLEDFATADMSWVFDATGLV